MVRALLGVLLVVLPTGLAFGGEPEGFITSCRLEKGKLIAGYEEGKEFGYLVPTGKKLAFAWADQPIVVHVPFTVSGAPGRPVQIVIAVGFDGFSADGLGRLDGRDGLSPAMPIGMVMSMGVASAAGAALGNGIDLQEGYEWEQQLDTPVLPCVEPPCALWRRAEDGQPLWFSEASIPRIPDGGNPFESGRCITVRFAPTAPRGTYSLWFAIPASGLFTNVVLPPEKMTGRFRAGVIAFHTAEFPDEMQVAAAAGLGETPEPMPRFTRLPDVVTEVIVRNNGWQVEESHTRVYPDEEGGTQRSLSGQGGQFTAEAKHAGEKHDWTARYRVTFPARILDRSACDVELSGSLAVPRCPYSEPEGPWGFRFMHLAPNDLAWLGFSEAARLDSAGQPKAWRMKPLLEEDGGLRIPAYRDEDRWKSIKGPRMAGLWVEPNDWGRSRPGPRQGVMRMLAGGPPRATAPVGMESFVDDGPWVLFELHLDEVGRLGQAYRRLSAVGSNELGGPGGVGALVTPGPEIADDGYHDFRKAWRKLRDDTLEAIEIAQKEILTLHGEIREKEADHRLRLAMFLRSQPIDQPEDSWLRILAGERNPPTATVGKRSLRILRDEMESLVAEIADRRARQRELIEEANEGMRRLVDALAGQARKSGFRRPYATGAFEMWRERAAMQTVSLYEAAGLREEFEAALGKLVRHSETLERFHRAMTASLRLMQGAEYDRKMWLRAVSGRPVEEPLMMAAQRMRVLAWQELRALREEEPGNRVHETVLRKLELRFLARIAEKLERERDHSLKGFQAYLTQRGYDLKSSEDWGPWAREYAMAFLGSAPIGWLYPIWDKVGAKAERAILTADSVAKNQISLLAIRRLRASGMSLSDIRAIEPETLRQRLVGPTGEQLSSGRARVLTRDIKETFAELYDLAALADGDEVGYSIHSVGSYYQPLEFESATPESFGDFFCSVNVGALFLPGTVVLEGQKWVMSPSSYRALQAAGGEMTTAPGALVRGLRLDKLGKAFTRNTTAGRWLRARLLRDRAWMQRQFVERYFRNAAVLGGVVIVYMGAHELAEIHDLPGLKIVIDALAILAAEQLLYDVLLDAGVSVRTIADKMDEAEALFRSRASTLKEQLADAGKMRRLIAEAEQAAASSGTTPLPEGHADALRALRKKYAIDPNDPVHALDADKEIRRALAEAGEAVEKGDVKQASRAVDATFDLAEQNTVAITRGAESIAALQKKLESVHTLDLERLAERRKGTGGSEPVAGRDRVPSEFWPEGGYPEHACADAWKEGDRLLLVEDFEGAIHHYRKAHRMAERDGLADSVKLIDEHLGMAASARTAKAFLEEARRIVPKIPAHEPIGLGDLEAIQQGITDGTLRVELLTTATNPVFVIKEGDRPLYVFKRIRAGTHGAASPQVPDVMDDAVRDNLIHEEFGALLHNLSGLGTRAPAARKTRLAFRYVDEQMGEVSVEGIGVVMRYLPSKELNTQREGVLHALKSEYARQRVLSCLLGDFDRHLKNSGVGFDHELWAFDFGWSWLRPGKTARRLGETFKNEKEYMEFCAGYSKRVQDLCAALRQPPENAGHYNWARRLEDIIDYDADMKVLVERLRTRLRADSGAGLMDMLEQSCHVLDANGRRVLDDAGRPMVDRVRVDEAFRVVNERLDLLEPVLKKQFTREISWASPRREPGDRRLGLAA